MKVLPAVLTTGTLVAGSVLAGAQAPALAWGNKANCAGHARFAHTNRWSPFVGHHVDVALRGCMTAGSKTKPPHLIWTARPQVTLPSKPGGGLLEKVELTKAPFYVSSKVEGGVTTVTRYKFSVKSCSTVKVVCQTFDFGVAYRLAGSQICFWGGACDTLKRW